MAESTLTLKFNDLQAEIGVFLGYGSGNTTPYADPAWSAYQLQRINSCVASGLRNFFFPTPPQGGPIYDWSFLRPTATLTMANGTQAMALPDDFGGFEGEITLLSTMGMLWFPIKLVNESQIRARYTASPTTSSRPEIAALSPIKGTTPTTGTRWNLIFYPIADQDYPVQFQYYVLPDFLDGSLPIPMGGMAHAETILESCLAVAEQRLDDRAGVHTANFQQRLLASIAADRRMKAQSLGYNGDNSDRPNRLQGLRAWFPTLLYKNGGPY